MDVDMDVSMGALNMEEANIPRSRATAAAHCRLSHPSMVSSLRRHPDH